MLGARCYRLALLVRVSGTSGCGTCMHVLATADKSRENRSLPLRGEGEGYSRKISCQASGPPHSARTPPRALRLATLAGRESAAARGSSLRSACVWHYHDHAIESAFAVSHRQDDRSGCLRALHNRLRIFARILTSPLQCWHRANLHHTCSLMLPPGFHRVGYPGDKNEHANRA